MAAMGFSDKPEHDSYDVVIVGGAMMGSAVAFYLSRRTGFDGRVLVIERDPSYADSSTAHTNSCLRQQFSTALNVRISRYAAEVIHDFPGVIGDARAPDLRIQNFGYLYLANDDAGVARLRAAQAVQAAEGTGTRLLTPGEIAAAYPFYDLDGIVLGSLNTVDEGYWEGGTVFDWFRRAAMGAGVEYLRAEVAGLELSAGRDRVAAVVTTAGERIACGQVVNAAGPRAAQVAAMAGIALPVEPRKRFTWVVRAETPLPRELPLTVDQSGVHMRQDGPDTYMIGSAGLSDPAVEPEDFALEPGLWEEQVWPRVAARIPAFERLRVVQEWAGHYAYNTLDQNAVVGPHDRVANFLFCNGFSGHGLQQAPAMGRGLAEWIALGRYEALDLSPLGWPRIAAGAAHTEAAVI